MTRRTFAQRMAAAGLDFAAIGVEPPEGTELALPGSMAPTVATPAATVSCRNYRAHQSAHHRTPAGWACDMCALPFDYPPLGDGVGVLPW